jgi:hypothetical protein
MAACARAIELEFEVVPVVPGSKTAEALAAQLQG